MNNFSNFKLRKILRNCPSLPNRIYQGITKVREVPPTKVAIKVGTGDFTKVGIMVSLRFLHGSYHGSYQGNTTMVMGA